MAPTEWVCVLRRLADGKLRDGFHGRNIARRCADHSVRWLTLPGRPRCGDSARRCATQAMQQASRACMNGDAKQTKARRHAACAPCTAWRCGPALRCATSPFMRVSCAQTERRSVFRRSGKIYSSVRRRARSVGARGLQAADPRRRGIANHPAADGLMRPRAAVSALQRCGTYIASSFLLPLQTTP